MTYKLDFYEEALKEWKKLDATVREQFKSKLAERLENPRLASAKLRDSKDRYKIKLPRREQIIHLILPLAVRPRFQIIHQETQI